MILINLMPHREAARKKAKESFYAKLILFAIVGAGLSLLIALGIGVLDAQQSTVNSKLRSENQSLDGKVKQIDEAKKVIDGLQARREAVENLQADRSLVVRWMEDLARLTPDGVYLTKVEQKELVLKVDGMALSNDQISQFIANTSSGNMQTITNSHWTGEIKVDHVEGDGVRPTLRVFLFTLEFELDRGAIALTAAPAMTR